MKVSFFFFASSPGPQIASLENTQGRKIKKRKSSHHIVYKTAVYTLVNSVITHQKQQITKNVILRSMTLPKCQCTAKQYHLF